MFRQWAIAGVLGCGGLAIAQPWPAVPADKPATETVYVMRTAGQNDRLVKVIRAADPADPASLAEVKDTASGQTFVIPGKVLAKLPKAGSTRPEPPAHVEATTPPPTPVPRAQPESIFTPPKAPPLPVEPKLVMAVPEPPAPVRAAKAESVSPQPLVARRPATAELPTVTPQVTVPSPVPQLVSNIPPQLPDLWRATGEAKAITPTPPPPVAGPRLTPVPTWRATPNSTSPGVQDPWRPSGG